jgi:hypothetical protein
MMDQAASLGDRPDPPVDASVLVQGTYTDKMLDWENKYQTDMRLAETRRVNDLSHLRNDYDRRIADDLRLDAKREHDHLAIELNKETTSLRALIEGMGKSFVTQLGTQREQFTTQLNTLRNEVVPAIAEINKFRYESGGKAAVADPALTESLRNIMTQSKYNEAQITGLANTLAQGGGKEMGKEQNMAMIFAVMSLVASLALVFVELFAHK